MILVLHRQGDASTAWYPAINSGGCYDILIYVNDMQDPVAGQAEWRHLWAECTPTAVHDGTDWQGRYQVSNEIQWKRACKPTLERRLHSEIRLLNSILKDTFACKIDSSQMRVYFVIDWIVCSLVCKTVQYCIGLSPFALFHVSVLLTCTVGIPMYFTSVSMEKCWHWGW